MREKGENKEETEEVSKSNLGGLLANNINPCDYGKSPVMQRATLLENVPIGYKEID